MKWRNYAKKIYILYFRNFCSPVRTAELERKTKIAFSSIDYVFSY